MQQQRSRLLRHSIADWTGASAAGIRVGRLPSGAPSVQCEGKELHASLASSAGVLLVGLAATPMGVDVEIIGEAREPPWNVLSRSERDQLDAIADPTARHLAFLRTWTAKEAVLKALGVGLSQEPRLLSIADPTGDPFVACLNEVPVRLRYARSGVFARGSDTYAWACAVL